MIVSPDTLSLHSVSDTTNKTSQLIRLNPETTILGFRLAVFDGRDRGAAVRSSGSEMTIGTATGSGLRLRDTAVSRYHCEVYVTPSGVGVRDLGSTNGTTVNGVKIREATLHPGAVIGVGRTRILIESDQDIEQEISSADHFGPVLGESVEMRRVFALLERVSATDLGVLIQGETGTGKGLIAKALHEHSTRANRPFAVVDCTALSSEQLESELFGHDGGSAAGPDGYRAGQFESINGGTIFLDEIGDFPIELQPKLLRVLETREVRPLGGMRVIPVNVRVITATSRDLRREVNDGRFRSDLWYCLDALRVRVPSLRERVCDIPLLARHFYATAAGDPEAKPPQAVVDTLLRGTWAGNVRELRNAVERALLFGDVERWRQATEAAPAVALAAFDPDAVFRAAKMEATIAWEQDFLTALIEYHGGNISKAARGARMDRCYLGQLLRERQIKIPGRD